MKILFVCPFPPLPARSGGALRLLHLAGYLARNHVLSMITFDNGLSAADRAALARLAGSVRYIRRARRPRLLQLLPVLLNFLRGIPFHAKYVQSQDLRRALRETTREQRFDVIVFEHTQMAIHLDALHPDHGARTVLSLHNIAALQYRRMLDCEKNPARKLRYFLAWLPLRGWEPRMAARVDQVITVSESDRAALLAQQPGLRISVVPNGVDTVTHRPFPPEGREKNLLLVGSMDYEPNVDAALYFARAIFPKIRQVHSDCRLTIVGQRPPDALRALAADPAISIHGDVPDVKPFYAEARIAVVPMRSGGGTRLKILEAMALGTPVVSTPVGCEGLDVQDGRDISIASHPADFADRVTRLLSDPQAWASLAQNGRKLVEEKYDWQTLGRRFEDVLRDLTTR